MKSQRKAILTEGPVAKSLLQLTIPMLFGIFGILIFNIVDTIFIGRYGALELAALSFTFPVVMTVTSLALGIGVGASAVISRAIGEGNVLKAKRLTTDSLFLSVSIVLLFVLFGLLTVNPLFRMLGAPPQILPLIRQYMLIWYPGMVFVVIPMVGNSAIRATGDMKTPGFIMFVAALSNCVLDPLLIFGLGPFPELGLAGAAIATVISRALTLCVALWVLHFRERLLTLKIPPLRQIMQSWKQILYIGLPSAGTRIIVPLTTGAITRIVASYGPEAVAGFGVASRIEFFSIAVIMALSSVIGPFIGQNLGAGRIDRIRRALHVSYRFSLVWGILIYIFFVFFAQQLILLVNKNETISAVCLLYLRIVPVCYGAMGMLLIVTTSLNVLNRPVHSAFLILFQMFGLYLPFACIGSHFFGLTGIFSVNAFAYVLIAAAGYFVVQKRLKEIA